MEILNNFSSIYCFIAFVIGAVFMLAMLSIVVMSKEKKPKNNVHFYVVSDQVGTLWLYMGKPVRTPMGFVSCNGCQLIVSALQFSQYGLNVRDFDNLKWEDEPVEVFINMED